MIPLIIRLDSSFESALFSLRSPLLVHFFEFVTFFGNAFSITILTISLAVVLARHHHKNYIAGLTVAVFGSLLVSNALKYIVLRPRPPYPYPAILETGYSFPSMHAAIAMAFFGFLAYVTYNLVHPPHHRLPLILALSAITILIGFSRLFLGVHYLSDVIGGYLVGVFFVVLAIVTIQRLKRR